MRLTETARKRVSRRLLGVFVCLCFALQPFGFPLHLALVAHASDASHELVKNAAAHSHSHSGYHHDHDQAAGRNKSDGGHPTHPVEDHIQFLPDIATSTPPALFVALALFPTPLKLFEPPTFSKAVVHCDIPPPRPLTRLVASPRAPPVAA